MTIAPGGRGEVLYEYRNGVAVVTLNAPERHNALTPSMADQLRAVCELVDNDEQVGAAVIRGAGQSFCAGAELGVLDRAAEDPAERERHDALGRIYEAFVRVSRLSVPTIAAVRGAAVGAGMNLALAADLRIVATDARLMAGFLRIGVHPGGGALTLLHRIAGREAAAAIALFGEELSGVRAWELGLAWEALPATDVEERALELATVAAGDPELSRLTARSLRAEAEAPMPLAIAVEYERGNQMWSLRRRATGTAG